MRRRFGGKRYQQPRADGGYYQRDKFDKYVRPDGSEYFPRVNPRVVYYHHVGYEKHPGDGLHYVVVTRTHDVSEALELIDSEKIPYLGEPEISWIKEYFNNKPGREFYQVNFNRPRDGYPAVVFRDLSPQE